MQIKPRVRFAPAPTGIMHLGNVRAALLNFLFAKKTGGTFILRIEDTDAQRNFDVGAHHILNDLHWLSLLHDEGPGIPDMTVSYFQSERTTLYQEQLSMLQERNLVYRCFCSPEQLEKKRDRQRALKQPPRYDRTCYSMPTDQILNRLENQNPFVWRLYLDHTVPVIIHDLAHGNISFDMANFSDFPLTRQDGSFTFIFSNFVDDYLMNITHVFRGEDHLSNSANQAVLYHYFNAPLPIFWHLPIITNIEGKKLSKRDFGFSLHDLRQAGFLPEAINNYLAIIGGSYKNEIMSQKELIESVNFDAIQSTGHIKYDVEKLRWINHQWIVRLSSSDLLERCKETLLSAYPQAKELDYYHLETLIQGVKTDLVTIHDVVPALAFYFISPDITHTQCLEYAGQETIAILHGIIKEAQPLIGNHELFMQTVKSRSAECNIKPAALFCVLRLILTGSGKGLGIGQLLALLPHAEIINRIDRGLHKLIG